MRVLLVTNDYPPTPGGIQQYLAGLVAHYPDPILVLAPRHDEAGELDGVNRHHAHFLLPTPAVAGWIAEYARSFAADAIVFGAPTPLPLLAAGLRRRLGLPMATIAHGAELTVPAIFPGLRQLLRRSLRTVDLRLTLSRWTAALVERIAHHPATVIGTGVDTDHFFPAGAVPAPPTVVGCVSRFVPRKGQDILLRAVARLRADGHDLEVLLVGAGRLEDKLRSLAGHLSVPTRFEVDVPYHRLGELYRQAHIFCMPCRSRWLGLEAEGFGLVFLEAAASGLPVLAGDSGGAPETVLPGVTGFVVAGEGHVVEGLRVLLGDPARAATMGRAGRERVQQDFSWGVTIGRLQQALRGVAAR